MASWIEYIENVTHYLKEGYSGKFIVISCLILALAASFWVRLINLDEWNDHPQKAFMHDGRPALIEPDGYLYLRYARDLIEGSYETEDSLRFYPQGTSRPDVPPLLSIITAAISNITEVALEHVGAWLPVVVAALTVFPLYWLGYLISGNCGGIAAAFVGTLSPFFVMRSQYGFYDTDCAIPLFIILLHCLAIKVTQRGSSKRWAYLAAYCVVSILFFIWWHTIPSLVVAISLAALYFSMLSQSRNRLLLRGLVLLGGGAILMFWAAPQFFGTMGEIFMGKFSGSVLVSNGEPAVISEQERIGILANAAQGYGHPAFALATAVGIATFCIIKPRMVVAQLPMIALGMLPFFWFHRFLVFSVPVMAIGAAGFFLVTDLTVLKSLRWRVWLSRAVIISVLGLGAFGCWRRIAGTVEWPFLSPYNCYIMEQLSKRLPEDALIWSWWDNGYPIQFYLRRPTLEDGGYFPHPGIVAFPLVINDEKVAAAWMNWVAGVGPGKARRCVDRLGIEKVAGELSGKGQELQPGNSDGNGEPCFDRVEGSTVPVPQVYLLLNHVYLNIVHWWFWYGTRLIDGQGLHAFYKPFYPINKTKGVISLGNGVTFSLAEGVFTGISLEANQAITRIDEIVYEYGYGRPGGLIFQADVDRSWAGVFDHAVKWSVFNRMFFSPEEISTDFTKVVNKAPQFQLWHLSHRTP